MGNCCSSLIQFFFPNSMGSARYSTISDEERENKITGSYQFSSGQESHHPFSNEGGAYQKSQDISISGSNGLQMQSNSNSSAFHLNYELKEEIGIGSTSKCYKCVKKSNLREYACKVIDKRQVEMKFSGLLDQFYLEIKVLKFLNHPNIIRLEETYETSDRIYMVLEMMKGGELFDYVVNKGTISEEEASNIVRQITSAVAHMHGLDIIHRDLKPENLLLANAAPGKVPQIKLIDFGLAKVLQEEVANSFLGTKGYLAPEMLQRLSYDKAVDMWALGVIVFVLLCGCLPFDDDSTKITSETVARKKFTLRFPKWASNLSVSAKDLLHNLLEVNPKTRYTASQALNHPWVSGKTVRENNYLQSPSMIGKRREELRSPQIQGYSAAARTNARAGAAATADIMYGAASPLRVYGGPIPSYGDQAGSKSNVKNTRDRKNSL